MAENKAVITRFPPSPTGLFHVGSARTALFNYLFAKQHGGKMYLRLEDTDKERSKPEFEEQILESLEWLKLPFDTLGEGKGYWRQSERSEIYRSYLEKLVASGAAYISKETPQEEGQRAEVIRFKNPNKKIVFNDLIRGDIEFDTSDLKDFVIAKSLEEPTYHLAVVVDDAEAGVTHVIRGEDHISNTPRQILIQEALGFPRPVYAHMPLILDEARAKLSKRKHGEKVSLAYYRNKGYLPEAMINFLALLGWNPGTDEEIFSLEELIKQFDIARVQKSGAIFNPEKLNWVNREYLLKFPVSKRKDLLKEALEANGFSDVALNPALLEKIAPMIYERIHVISDVAEMISRGELEYLHKTPEYEPGSLMWKGETDTKAAARRISYVLNAWNKIEESEWKQDALKTAVWEYAEKEGKGSVLWPVRFALSGLEKSPDPFALAYMLGKTTTLDRLHKAVALLNV